MKLKSVKTVMYGHTWEKAHQSTKDQVSTSISPDIFRALGVPTGHRATLQIQRLIERQTHTNLNIFS